MPLYWYKKLLELEVSARGEASNDYNNILMKKL